MISFDGTSVAFDGREVLHDIHLDIGAEEFVCVIGPSGCGKTTLLRVLAGLQRATGGRVLLEGQPMSRPRQDVAVVFQDYAHALLPWRTAGGNIALALEAVGTPKAEWSAITSSLLESMGLSQYSGAFPEQMSGGMQQRLQIARCLAQRPKVLLMDEPFGALDAMTRQALQDEVKRITSKLGTTVFFVTHDLDEAVYLGDRVVGLLPGPGRVAEIFDVKLPAPRDQLSTREHPEFLRLRRELFRFIHAAEH